MGLREWFVGSVFYALNYLYLGQPTIFLSSFNQYILYLWQKISFKNLATLKMGFGEYEIIKTKEKA